MNEAQHLEEKSEPVAMEQQGELQEQAEQQAPGEKSEGASAPSAAAAADAPTHKKRRKKAPPPRIEDITPRPSFWPILLAVALCIAVIGLDIHPIVFVLGLLLVITAIIGWGVERR